MQFYFRYLLFYILSNRTLFKTILQQYYRQHILILIQVRISILFLSKPINYTLTLHKSRRRPRCFTQLKKNRLRFVTCSFCLCIWDCFSLILIDRRNVARIFFCEKIQVDISVSKTSCGFWKSTDLCTKDGKTRLF